MSFGTHLLASRFSHKLTGVLLFVFIALNTFSFFFDFPISPRTKLLISRTLGLRLKGTDFSKSKNVCLTAIRSLILETLKTNQGSRENDLLL